MTSCAPRSTVHVRMDAPEQIVLHLGIAQGVAGPPGEEGEEGPTGPAGGALIKVAARALPPARVVRVVDDGQPVDLADPRDIMHAHVVVGIARRGALAAGDDVEIMQTGECDSDDLDLAPGLPVYLGPDGTLVQEIDPTWAFVRELGVASTTTRMVVDLQPPIFLDSVRAPGEQLLAYSDGHVQTMPLVDVSQGAASAGHVARLNQDGVFDRSVLPADLASEVDSDKNYVHIQGVPAALWVVPHGLGKEPAVTVLDSANSEIDAEIVHISINLLHVISAFPFSGRAVCN